MKHCRPFTRREFLKTSIAAFATVSLVPSRVLGRAAKLAAETGNDEATNKLKRVVDIADAETGTVRLKRDVSKLDEMALDTSSTKTTRVR